MAARNYVNFDLLIEQESAGHFQARVTGSPQGATPSVRFTLPYDPTTLENLLLKLDPGRSGTRRAGASTQQQAGIDFGGPLYRAVFRDDLLLTWTRSLDLARQQDAGGLRLRLRLNDAPTIAGLPWELLYDARTNSFIAQSERTPVVRYLDVPQSPRAMTVDGPLHVLALISSPVDQDELDVDAEWELIGDAVRPQVEAGLVVLDRLPRPTMAELGRWLRRHETHVLHFVGHGAFHDQLGEGVIYLQDRHGRSAAVSASVLGPQVKDHDPLRMVVLNACRSARADLVDPFSGLAQGLVQQDATAVVAMQFPISDRAAVTFTGEFYGAIVDGLPVDQSITSARKSLLADFGDEWATPVLFLRAPDGNIFADVHALPDAAPAPPPLPPPPDEAPPDDVPPDQAPPDQAPPNQAPDQAPPDQAPPGDLPSDEAPPDQTPPGDLPLDEAPPDDVPPDEAPPDEGGSDGRRRLPDWYGVRARWASGALALAVVVGVVVGTQLADRPGEAGPGGQGDATPSGTPNGDTDPDTDPDTGLPASAPLTDGQLLVAAGSSPPALRIHLVDTDDGSAVQVTDGPVKEWLPVLSPDRATMIYSRILDGPTSHELRTAGVDGSGDRALFETPEECTANTGRPAWSATEPTHLVMRCLDSASVWRLVLVDVDGTVLRTYATTEAGEPLRNFGDPTISPDGRTIVFWGSTESGNAVASGALYAVDIGADGDGDGDGGGDQEGQEPTLLVGSEADQSYSDPVFSPDGSRLAFRQSMGGNFEIVAVPFSQADRTVGDPVRLTDSPAVDEDPMFSPDGSRVAFSRRDANGTRILVVPVGGGEPVPLLEEGLDRVQLVPAWSRR
ncbi:CHAT domain-containing protein [Nocardioides donggukensis]|uniref:CHAT domain-containing protein n=1 Tax=Nocardioides donggukensis TaxID=2774019 RepID=A0A927K4S0_9ACTN|nr:CHAT domain-containing protein [Nocardioides donggukensis]MBD8870187.1 CHAT domain-containing protein [Nocardioides donggukensis]